MNTKIVIDCSFGDGGKGLVVDNLCNPGSLVVRFSGGQQCGHTVVRDGKRHVFSSFGSGTLQGCPTFFTEDTTMYLPCIANEHKVLKELGVEPKLIFHPLTIVTTPYDVAYGRMREACLKHGSCGLGVGATMMRHNDTPYKIFAIDFTYPAILFEKIDQIRQYYVNKVRDEPPRNAEFFHTEAAKLMQAFCKAEFTHGTAPYFTVEDIKYVKYTYENVVFEGSQGILLDMDHGVFPNVTYANTTCKNALKYINKWELDEDEISTDVEIYYVTRCYTTRHGRGWMPCELPVKLVNNDKETNVYNPWQEQFRTGPFDYDMINYAINIDKAYHKSNYSANLVVTCLDQLPDFKLDTSRITTRLDKIYTNASPEAGNLKRL